MSINEYDLRSLWRELDDFELELEREAVLLQDVWLRIAALRSDAEKEQKSLSTCPEYDFVPSNTLICLNVGGHLVELPAELLCRDPASALAALCRRSPPVQPSPHGGGGFYIDRDGWIFRHVINYLKNDMLPSDAETLKELYREATFFHLRSLQVAIENLPVSKLVVGPPSLRA